MVVLVLFFLLFALLALDRQRIVGQLDLDVLLVYSRQVGGDFVAFIGFGDVNGGLVAAGTKNREVFAVGSISLPRSCLTSSRRFLEVNGNARNQG